jgi:hypothetical protein
MVVNLTTNAPVRVMVDLDWLRSTDSNTDTSVNSVTLAIARSLLAEIDRLSCRLDEAERRIRSLENQSVAGYGSL